MKGRQAGTRAGPCHSGPVQDEGRRQHLSARVELLIVITLATVYFVWFAWPLVWSASENVRLVGAFNTDEETHVRLLSEAIENRSPRLGYIPYGYAYLNMGLMPLFLLSYLRQITEQQIILWLRIIPTLFAIATVALTFVMARRYFGRLAAWLSAILLSFTVLSFLEMSVMSHADIPQVFFLVLGIFLCCCFVADGRLRWLVAGSAAAGVAFGCKYSGFLLLPVIGVVAALHTMRLDDVQISVNTARIVRVSRLLAAFAGVGLIVLGAAIIPYAAAPYSGAVYFGVFIPGLLNSLGIVSAMGGAGLVVLAALPPLWAAIRRRPKLCSLLKLGMLSVAAFSAAFLITSPFNVLSVRAGFLRGFLYESLHSSFGHDLRAQTDRLQWFSLLSSRQLLDPLVLALAVVHLALAVHKAVKEGWEGLLEPASVMWLWTLGQFGFLVWLVNLRTHRSMLPMVPFLLLFAAHAFSQAVKYATARLSKPLVCVVTVASLSLFIGLELPRSLDRMLEFRQSTSSRDEKSDVVLTGQWLSAHYASSTRVLYDHYTYIPPRFGDAYVTPWGGTVELLETLKPEVVVVSTQNSDRFADAELAERYARDEEEFMARHEYYAALADGQAGYQLVRACGSILVYESQTD